MSLIAAGRKRMKMSRWLSRRIVNQILSGNPFPDTTAFVSPSALGKENDIVGQNTPSVGTMDLLPILGVR